MGYEMAGKVVFITGAASGIGRAIAEHCASAGAALVLLDVDETGLAAAKVEITKTWDTHIIPLVCDLRDVEQVQQIPEALLSGVDVLINNAGIGSYGPFIERTFEEFEQITRVNYLSLVQLTQRYLAVRDLMRASAIVNFSSLVGLIELPFMSAYTASKFAVSAFTRCLRLELAHTQVHVMTVYPGPARTNFGRQYGHHVDFDDPKNRRRHQPPERVAHAVIRGLVSRRKTVIVPRYFGAAVFIRNMFPRIYDMLGLRIGSAVVKTGRHASATRGYASSD
jgi:short-subunit dehydrogenase